MASSRGTSNGPDLQDTIQALHHFEQFNKCRIILTIRSCGSKDAESVWWEAKALSESDGSGVRKLLASAQLSCGQANVTTMDAAIQRLLHALDFELAQAEFVAAAK